MADTYLKSVEDSAKEILEKYPTLHVLIERDDRGRFPTVTVRVKIEPRLQERRKR